MARKKEEAAEVAPASGWWVASAVSLAPDEDGLPRRVAGVVYGDAAAADAHPVPAGFERQGTTPYGEDVGGALRHATLYAHVGRETDAGEVPEATSFLVTGPDTGDPAREVPSDDLPGILDAMRAGEHLALEPSFATPGPGPSGPR